MVGYLKTVGLVVVAGIFGYLFSIPIRWLMEFAGLRECMGDLAFSGILLAVILVASATVIWLLGRYRKGGTSA